MQATKNRTNGPKPRWFALLALACVFAPGCSICCQPHLEDYVAFGSRTPRTNMKYGRVGSPFSDPEANGSVISQPAYEAESGGPVYYDYEQPTGTIIGQTEEIYFEGE